jgi:hypothetical protein
MNYLNYMPAEFIDTVYVLVKSGQITMSRGRELLGFEKMEEMREFMDNQERIK